MTSIKNCNKNERANHIFLSIQTFWVGNPNKSLSHFYVNLWTNPNDVFGERFQFTSSNYASTQQIPTFPSFPFLHHKNLMRRIESKRSRGRECKNQTMFSSLIASLSRIRKTFAIPPPHILLSFRCLFYDLFNFLRFSMVDDIVVFYLRA